MKFQLTKQYQKNKTSIGVLLVILLGTSLALGLSYMYTNRLLQSNFSRTFEKKSWDQVGIAHSDAMQSYTDFFTGTSLTAQNIAKLPSVVIGLQKGDRQTLQAVLAEQNKVNDSITSTSILDANGALVAVSSLTVSDLSPYFGRDFSGRDYFKTVVSTKKAFVSSAFTTAGGKVVVAFSAPILTPDGNLIGVLSVFRSIGDLSTLKKYSTMYASYYTIVTDSKGSLLIDNDKLPNVIRNISHDDQVVNSLVSNTATTTQDQETNYRNEKALAVGSSINIGGQRAFFVVTYYAESQSTQELETFQDEITNLYIGTIFRDLLIMLGTYGIVIWLFRKHVVY
jgi:hypothetical protein